MTNDVIVLKTTIHIVIQFFRTPLIRDNYLFICLIPLCAFVVYFSFLKMFGQAVNFYKSKLFISYASEGTRATWLSMSDAIQHGRQTVGCHRWSCAKVKSNIFRSVINSGDWQSLQEVGNCCTDLKKKSM